MTLGQVIEQETVEVVVDGYGYRGEGYVRLEDGWLSIPGAIPGERVSVAVSGEGVGSRRIWGQLLEVLEPAGARRDPFCDRFAAGACRGCQLRHLSVAAELEFKRDAVIEVIAKYAKVAVEDQPPVRILTPQPSARGDAYRIRASLKYRRTEGGFELGLVTRDAIIGMRSCPALTEPVQRTISRVEEALQAWHAAGRLCEIERIRLASPVHGHGYVEVIVPSQDPALESLMIELDERLPRQFGLAWVLEDRRTLVRPLERFRLPSTDLRLEVGYDDWFHATLTPAEVLYEHLVELLALTPDETVLDAGCGIGTITMLAARRAREVVGFDVNAASIDTAEYNAALNDATNARFVCAGWERAFRELALAEEHFDVVTINPMREPLGRRPLSYLEKLGTRRVIYLGPSPASAAKDIGELVDMGWRIDELAVANLHPHTYHAMLVARLVV